MLRYPSVIICNCKIAVSRPCLSQPAVSVFDQMEQLLIVPDRSLYSLLESIWAFLSCFTNLKEGILLKSTSLLSFSRSSVGCMVLLHNEWHYAVMSWNAEKEFWEKEDVALHPRNTILVQPKVFYRKRLFNRPQWKEYLNISFLEHWVEKELW